MTATHAGQAVAVERNRLLFWAIALSSATFVFILALAAYWDHTIIWLHLFQSFQYAAIVALAARRNLWGYLFGIAVAAFWIYIAAFVTNFVQSGFENLNITLRTAVVTRPDQLIAVLAFVSQLTLLFACAMGYLRLAVRPASDWIRFLASIVGAVAYLIVSFAVFQPRYLAMVPRLLHPHGF